MKKNLIKMYLANLLRYRSIASCDKMLSVKDSLLLEIKKHEKYQICVKASLVITESLSCCLAGL